MVMNDPTRKVFLGSTKMDKARRISLIKIVADRLGAIDGDFVLFFYDSVSGNIVIEKSNKEQPVQILSDNDKEELMDKNDILREIIKRELFDTPPTGYDKLVLDATPEEIEEMRRIEIERLDNVQKMVDEAYIKLKREQGLKKDKGRF